MKEKNADAIKTLHPQSTTVTQPLHKKKETAKSSQSISFPNWIEKKLLRKSYLNKYFKNSAYLSVIRDNDIPTQILDVERSLPCQPQRRRR